VKGLRERVEAFSGNHQATENVRIRSVEVRLSQSKDAEGRRQEREFNVAPGAAGGSLRG
jgi:hypothetical protein